MIHIIDHAALSAGYGVPLHPITTALKDRQIQMASLIAIRHYDDTYELVKDRWDLARADGRITEDALVYLIGLTLAMGRQGYQP